MVKIASPATAAGDYTVHYTRPVATKQPGLEAGRLPCLGSHAGTSLQDCSAWHSWPQDAPHWDLVEDSTDCDRQSHWRVGTMTMTCVKAKGCQFEHSCNQPALFRTTLAQSITVVFQFHLEERWGLDKCKLGVISQKRLKIDVKLGLLLVANGKS